MKRSKRSRSPFIHLVGISAGVLLVVTSALAEKADRGQEVIVTYDRATGGFDDLNGVFEGNVVLTQGTLRITAARMKVKSDSSDQVFAELFGAAGAQVTFRSKREGTGEFVEGSSDRAEFDQAANSVKLFSKANIKSGNNQLAGEYVYYNTETEKFEVSVSKEAVKPGSTPTEAARGRLVFQPRSDATKPKK